MARRTKNRTAPGDFNPAEFTIAPDDPLAEEHALIEAFLEQSPRRGYTSHEVKLEKSEAGKQMVAADRQTQCRLVEALVPRVARLDQLADEARARGSANVGVHEHFMAIWEPRGLLYAALRRLLRKKLPFNERQIIVLADWLGGCFGACTYTHPLSGAVKAAENYAADNELTEPVREALGRYLEMLRRSGEADQDCRKFAERVEKALGAAPAIPLRPGEAWSDAALADLAAMPAAQQAAWAALLAHCQVTGGGKPAAKWAKTARTLLEAVGEESFRKQIVHWFPLVDKPRTAAVETWSQWSPNPNLMLLDLHAEILKGLAWCSSFEEDKDVARALTGLAVSAYKKVPGIGPRAVKVGNACVYALGAMPGMEGVGQLALLKVKVKFRTAQKGIEKALETTAERVGIPREELEEMGVPAYGLTDVGRLEEPLGDFTAELSVTGTASTQLVWRKADGKTQKSVPAAVKKDFAEELKELKATAKDIQKMLPAQRERIDNMFLAQKSWPYETWRQRYLEHPLVGTLARRLIWRFTTGGETADGIYCDGEFTRHDGRAIENLGEGTTVALWHPIDHSTEEVVAWRSWLEEHQLQQPFKQAHREVYVLTDAERTTGTYSNRYAAHVLKQHQFNALCAARGWRNSLRLMVDDDFPPATLRLPGWNLRAEFWVEGAGDEYGVDTNETGTYLYLTTDQVRFYALDAAENWAHASGGGYRHAYNQEPPDPLTVADIPPLVFSEVMRDVDLFVGVASVGNDPTWADGGPQGRYVDYWNSYSFGDLTATSQTRKEVLSHLVPRLKIADRCTFSDKFLVVRGDLRTYKIHLGSGNILMEPNDQYLCIVARQGARGTDKVFLPFEGDNMLSIILSKAFLLAEDTKITDTTITSQIERA